MGEEQLLARITVDARICGGRPSVRGHRLAVEQIVNMLLAGDSINDLLAAYPWLELADLNACLLYTGRAVADERIYPFTLPTVAHEAPVGHIDRRPR